MSSPSIGLGLATAEYFENSMDRMLTRQAVRSRRRLGM
ncbi:hypothetical protein MMEU_4217 [Mycobacterium marinum str. Europe]|nr:hypothetical protein MMEU_4217 [Mycobacterium marinum str. Europe]